MNNIKKLIIMNAFFMISSMQSMQMQTQQTTRQNLTQKKNCYKHIRNATLGLLCVSYFTAPFSPCCFNKCCSLSYLGLEICSLCSYVISAERIDQTDLELKNMDQEEQSMLTPHDQTME